MSSHTTCKDAEFYEFSGSHYYFWKRRKIWKSKMFLIPHLWIWKMLLFQRIWAYSTPSIHHNFKKFNLFWCHLQWRIDGFKKYKQKYFGVNANEPSLSMLIGIETWKLFIYLLNARLEKMHLRIFQFYLDIFSYGF